MHSEPVVYVILVHACFLYSHTSNFLHATCIYSILINQHNRICKDNKAKYFSLIIGRYTISKYLLK